MKRILLRPGLPLALVIVTLTTPANVGAATHKQVFISKVSVTASKEGGESAVVMSITTSADSPISLLSVTSPDSRMGMIYFDTNMCQGNHTMTWLANIFISGGHTQQLGYKYQGAMISDLKQAFVKGQRVPLVIKWSDFQNIHTETVRALVVAPPPTLHFLMSPMKM